MASVEFRQVPVDQLCTMPEQAYIFLDQACRETRDIITVKMAVDGCISGLGLIFMVFADNVLSGCMYVSFKINHLGKVMNMSLLGGINFDAWFDDLTFFLNRLAKDRDVNEFMLMGRRGWEKKIKDMEFVGIVLRKKIK